MFTKNLRETEHKIDGIEKQRKIYSGMTRRRIKTVKLSEKYYNRECLLRYWKQTKKNTDCLSKGAKWSTFLEKLYANYIYLDLIHTFWLLCYYSCCAVKSLMHNKIGGLPGPQSGLCVSISGMCLLQFLKNHAIILSSSIICSHHINAIKSYRCSFSMSNMA